MRITYSNTLFTGAAAALSCFLIVNPTSLGAQSFAYAGIKGGYTYSKIDKMVLKAAKADAINPFGVSFNPFSASAASFGANAGWGSYFTPRFGFRLEGEYIYRLGFSQTEAGWNPKARYSYDGNGKISLHFQTLLGNAYLDYYVNPSASLYLSFGLGMSLSSSMLNYQQSSSGNDKTNTLSTSFAWQVGLGTAFALTESLWLDLNLRYIDLGNFVSKISIRPEIENSKGTTKASAFEGVIGLNWRF